MEEPDDPKSFEDVYIITELMETDLHKIICSKQELTSAHIAYIMYQLLRGVKYTHSSNVIHRDLKPSNILLNRNCEVRVCDFGLARGIDESGAPLTEYVVTRWYRAPEIMLACPEYTKPVDMWSVGCIMAELLGRKPLFAGTDYVHQLQLITSILGSPADSELAFVTSARARAFLVKEGYKSKVAWSSILPSADPLAVDLLDNLLVFNPAKRLTVEEALAHPFFTTLHCPEDEPSHAVTFDSGIEIGGVVDTATLRKLMCGEIAALKRYRAYKAALAVEAAGQHASGKEALLRCMTGGTSTKSSDHPIQLAGVVCTDAPTPAASPSLMPAAAGLMPTKVPARSWTRGSLRKDHSIVPLITPLAMTVTQEFIAPMPMHVTDATVFQAGPKAPGGYPGGMITRCIAMLQAATMCEPDFHAIPLLMPMPMHVALCGSPALAQEAVAELLVTPLAGNCLELEAEGLPMDANMVITPLAPAMVC